ncbi:MAG TPA: ATP synthase F1 subunit epsilon [Verrucomicrobiota bacterium]|nr:ATP synthase F1 subunit epsilon [Verrucomicrobiota bacterium]HNU51617.1 ATP synthase F1 subunit epsilon [Verrucomicrobiota bacterium]
MAATLKLEIVTPEGVTCSETVEMVTLPGVEGEMGIYPMHVPLVTEIVPGEIVVRRDGADHYLAVGPGFVEITADRVAVLTDMALRADDLDEKKAEQARRAAESRLKDRLGEGDAATVNAAIVRSIEHLRGRRRSRK